MAPWMNALKTQKDRRESSLSSPPGKAYTRFSYTMSLTLLEGPLQLYSTFLLQFLPFYKLENWRIVRMTCSGFLNESDLIWWQLFKANLDNFTPKETFDGSKNIAKRLRTKIHVGKARNSQASELPLTGAQMPPCLSSLCSHKQTDFLHVAGSVSPYIPTWTSFLGSSFRSPRERLWLAQLGQDTGLLTNQLWPGYVVMWECVISHRNYMDRGGIPAISGKWVYRFQKRVWSGPQNSNTCQFHHQEVEESGFMPRSVGLQSPHSFSFACGLSESLSTCAFGNK
jgi:hypothetical protein